MVLVYGYICMIDEDIFVGLPSTVARQRSFASWWDDDSADRVLRMFHQRKYIWLLATLTCMYGGSSYDDVFPASWITNCFAWAQMKAGRRPNGRAGAGDDQTGDDILNRMKIGHVLSSGCRAFVR